MFESGSQGNAAGERAGGWVDLRVDYPVPTYVYETTDPSKRTRRFEITQSVHDKALRRDPKTGEAVRRVITTGSSILVRGKSMGPSVGSVGSH